jgi:hypothetical protein
MKSKSASPTKNIKLTIELQVDSADAFDYEDLQKAKYNCDDLIHIFIE